jgi:hypothetical protein
MPMMKKPINMLKGTWTRLLNEDRLQRSSQVLSVIDQTVCIFGGEVKPRQPVDDKIDVFSLKPGEPRFIAIEHGAETNLM